MLCRFSKQFVQSNARAGVSRYQQTGGDACRCAAAGASMINDVRALMLRGRAVEAAADVNLPVCLMHMQGEPRTMQSAPHYEDVVRRGARISAGSAGGLRGGGIAASQVVIDPGFGFGKTLEHNLELFDALDRMFLLEGVSPVGRGFP